MSSKIVLQDIGSGYNLPAVVNNNNDFIEEAFDNTLSRDGSTPNGMLANLDMNSFKIINLGAPVDDNDAVRLIDLQGVTGGGGGEEPAPSSGSTLIASSGWGSTVTGTDEVVLGTCTIPASTLTPNGSSTPVLSVYALVKLVLSVAPEPDTGFVYILSDGTHSYTSNRITIPMTVEGAEVSTGTFLHWVEFTVRYDTTTHAEYTNRIDVGASNSPYLGKQGTGNLHFGAGNYNSTESEINLQLTTSSNMDGGQLQSLQFRVEVIR